MAEEKRDFGEYIARLRATREQAAQDRRPEYHVRQSERAGTSNWSGGSMGGGTWAARSRGDREQP
jgi:hypothetical protein